MFACHDGRGGGGNSFIYIYYIYVVLADDQVRTDLRVMIDIEAHSGSSAFHLQGKFTSAQGRC
jgi:hypothetical protein